MPRPPDPKDFLPLHPFDLRILLVLAEGPAHGYPIVRVIEERDSSWKRVLPANLYRRPPVPLVSVTPKFQPSIGYSKEQFSSIPGVEHRAKELLFQR